MIVTWGLVTTLRAPLEKVLNFAAWHLQLGADHLYLHLDDPDDPALPLLSAHPRITAVATDTSYWQGLRGHRPARHQPRQTANATRVYSADTGCDWLAHIDVDEFLLPNRPVAQILQALPESCHAARLRPREALATDTPQTEIAFKSFALPPALRRRQTERIYPTYGPWLNGGMLSHVAGKLFVRKGLPRAELRIHNIDSAYGQNPGQVELPEIPLAHFHADSWDDWLGHYRYRLEKGAYRAELKPANVEQPQNLHALLRQIETRAGQAGLRAFFEETSRDTPELRARLAAEGQLHLALMDLKPLRDIHFPGASGAAPP